MANNEERVRPITITDKTTGAVYELDFSRESIKFAEARGFETDDVLKFPVTKFPELFYYSFRKNHRNMSRSQTDALYDRIGGFTPEALERFLLLYSQAATANNIIEDGEEMGKNGNVTVEL